MSVRPEGESIPSNSNSSPGASGVNAVPETLTFAENMHRLFGTDLPEWGTGSFSDPMPPLQKAMIGFGTPLSTGYDNPSVQNQAYRLSVALDRDSRLNAEERQQYLRTEAELEFGFGFFERAHP